ncbi:bifunctional nuclease family protein [Halobaculum sp. MBLA0143]|uniref:bifunctional nuclease family protein n=1 Tax=Halobaculum sp. MBLA0143 TaxID=3079933 RepID=UPI003526ABF4
MSHEAEIAGIGVGVGPDGDEVPAVILRAREQLLPIFVTRDQANSVRMGLSDRVFERPLTHDLLVEMVTEFGGAVDGVRIDDLTDGTFYAKIDAESYDAGQSREFVFDARPSDAIALAIRFECPITVADEVLDAAGQPPDSIEIESRSDGVFPHSPGEEDRDESDFRYR